VSRRSPVLALTLALACLAAPVAVSAQPQVAAVVTTPFGSLDRVEYTVVDGPGPLDRFKAVRILRRGAPPRPQALLLLPPLGVNFGFYEQTDPHGGVASSIAGFFALRGYDVWQYVARMEGIPAGNCEAGILDCSPMAGWNLASMVDDVAFVRSLLEAENPGAEVATGGASLGGILALAVVNDAPADYDGALVWEGMLYTPNPAVRALNQAFCAQAEALLAGGIYYDGAGGAVLKQLARQAELVPGGLTQVPLLPPVLTNRQALVAFFRSPPPGPVTTPVPGYYFLAGDPVAGEFEFASAERVITNVERFTDYAPIALTRDVSCHLAGLDDTHVDNLGAFAGRVLGIGGGGGFGPYIPDNLALFTGASRVDFLLEPAFGHVDHFMTLDHRRYVERPVLRWLRGESLP
jgi:hypothetical protein